MVLCLLEAFPKVCHRFCYFLTAVILCHHTEPSAQRRNKIPARGEAVLPSEPCTATSCLELTSSLQLRAQGHGEFLFGLIYSFGPKNKQVHLWSGVEVSKLRLFPALPLILVPDDSGAKSCNISPWVIPPCVIPNNKERSCFSDLVTPPGEFSPYFLSSPLRLPLSFPHCKGTYPSEVNEARWQLLLYSFCPVMGEIWGGKHAKRWKYKMQKYSRKKISQQNQGSEISPWTTKAFH